MVLARWPSRSQARVWVPPAAVVRVEVLPALSYAKVRVADPAFGPTAFLGRVWNPAVDLAAGLIRGLIDTVTRPVVNLMVQVFGLVATIA